MSESESSFDHKTFLRSLTPGPGVYRMLNAQGQVMYVGKAKNLRRRVGSYFTRAANRRIASMVAQIQGIEITATHTEAEALLLENNLIKEHKPRYNVLLRDDKSYPYLFLSDEEFPRLAFHRGARRSKGRYFGPYPSASAVRETLQLLQKLFPVRQCAKLPTLTPLFCACQTGNGGFPMKSDAVLAISASTSRVPIITSWPRLSSFSAMTCPTTPVPNTPIFMAMLLGCVPLSLQR